MRAAFEVGLLLGVMGLSAGIAAFGCSDPKCDQEFGTLECQEASTGPVDEACDPTQDLTAPVADDCGVFVRLAGDDANPGTKAEPVKTIAKAVERWKGKPKTPGGAKSAVYVCSEEFTEAARVDLPSGLVMFGGLDCNAAGAKAWVYVPPDQAQSETVITAPEGTIPLRILPSADESVITTLSTVHVTAKTVPDMMLGGSSIAVIADNANVEFVRSVLETGNAAKGEDGAPYDMPAQGGVIGNDGKDACDMAAFMETKEPMGTCSAGVVSTGGVGASGGVSSTGVPTGGTPGADNAGTSEASGMPCTAGKVGFSPDAAESGEPVSGLGTLNNSDGYKGVAGNSGTPGAIGQGGGGGGGTRSKPVSAATNLCGTGPGASGGSGGTGGCGGEGGRPGKPGGSSIAVVSLNSTIKLTETRIKVGNGGSPGLGGSGQTGGPGGAGGLGGAAKMGVAAGCNGGDGGKGGDGGAGSDGIGGHSIGIAYTDVMPDPNVIIESLGDPGTGGKSKPTLQIPAAAQ